MSKFNCAFFKLVLVIYLISLKCSPILNISLEAQSVSESNAAFANLVYNALHRSSTENLVFSPFGLTTALWMLADGARGTTKEEIKSGLRLSDLDDITIGRGFSDILSTINATENSAVRITLNNRFFISRKYDLKYEFVSTIQNVWKSDVKSVNFSENYQTASEIDDWIAHSSKSKLKSLFETENLEEDLSSVLISIGNIGGSWKKKFGRASIRERPFFVNENDRVKVEMMTLADYFRHADFPELESTAIFLPYQGDRFGLIVLLPNYRTGLGKLVENLRNFPFSKIPGRLKRRWVELSLPKFKLEKTFDLVRNGLLSKLGIRSLLYEMADFTGISCQTGVHISQVLQSCSLEVNEEGMDGRSPPTFNKINSFKPTSNQPTIRFYVDHPFIMFVYDQLTRSILLVGQKIN